MKRIFTENGEWTEEGSRVASVILEAIFEIAKKELAEFDFRDAQFILQDAGFSSSYTYVAHRQMENKKKS